MYRFFSIKKVYILILLFDMAVMARALYLHIYDSIPDNILMFRDECADYDFGVPVSLDFDSECENAINVVGDGSNELSMSGSENGNYNANVKIFGLLNIKEVSVSVVEPVELFAIGKCTGIYVETDGIMVLGFCDINDKDSLTTSPGKNILKEGDYILSVNNHVVYNSLDLENEIQNSDSDKIILTIRRDDEEFDVAVNRILCDDEQYRLGLWVRENLQGIGTLTYSDDEGYYAALGHSINDASTGMLLEIRRGEIYRPDIFNIIKGQEKKPGEIYGAISYNREDYQGEIMSNNSCGIFGILDKNVRESVVADCSKYNIKLKNEINKGDASIICDVDGERKEYAIQIVKTDINSSNNRDMVIKITDEVLLNKTNGIVQGMSGSPIIQDGKLIGAVTHVFVNDPTKGYGIFIENMLE